MSIFGFISRYILQKAKFSTFMLTLSMVLIVAVGMLMARSIQYATRILFYANDSRSMISLLLGGLLLALLRFSSGLGYSYFLTRFVELFMADMQRSVMRTILLAPMHKLESMGMQRFGAPLAGDIGSLRGFLSSSFFPSIRDGLTVAGLLGYALYINWLTAIVFIGIMSIAGIYIRFVSRSIQSKQSVNQVNLSLNLQTMDEVVRGMRIVRIFGQAGRVLNSYREFLTNSRRNQQLIAIWRASTGPMVEAVGILGLTASVVLATWMVSRSRLEASQFTGILACALLSLQPMRNLSSVFVGYGEFKSSMERLVRLLNFIQPDAQVSDAVKKGDGVQKQDPASVLARYALNDASIQMHTPDTHEGSSATRLRSIEARHVRFAYVNELEHFEAPQLVSKPKDPITTYQIDDVSVRLQSGDRVALIGPSGSGKSTLVALLLGFLRAQHGQVLHNNATFGSNGPDLSRISFIGQEVLLFTGTIQENIRIGKPTATLSEVEQAAKWANAHDFIMQLPLGYDTKLSEAGRQLSSGQRQRLSIARALIKPFDLLVMDEASSSLDKYSEWHIFNQILINFPHACLLIVTHRLELLPVCNRIVCMQSGRILDQGTHEVLLERCSFYRDLLELRIAQVAKATSEETT